MEKEIFDALSQVAQGEPPCAETVLDTPSIKIKSDVAFCLSTMMTTVGERLNMSPQRVFEQIVSGGIQNMLQALSPAARRSAGISLNSDSPIGAPSVPGRMTPVRGDQSTDDPEDDALAAKAQQAAFEKMNEMYGYTPMTAHAMSNDPSGKSKNAQQGDRSRQNNRPSKKKKYKKVAKNKHRETAGSSNGGGPAKRRRRGTNTSRISY